MDYLDDLIKNHPLTDDEYIFKKKIKNNQSGGQLDKPTGGFPPIILCDKLKQKEMIDKSDEKVKREFKTNKNTVSIKSIMEKRRNIKPFIQI